MGGYPQSTNFSSHIFYIKKLTIIFNALKLNLRGKLFNVEDMNYSQARIKSKAALQIYAVTKDEKIRAVALYF